MFVGSPIRKDAKSGKTFYRQLDIGGKMFSLRDFVHLKGEEKDFPYIGAIQEFYRCHEFAKRQTLGVFAEAVCTKLSQQKSKYVIEWARYLPKTLLIN